MKFSIGDLQLVTTIAALAAGWYVDRQSLVDEVKKLKKPDYTIYKRGGRQDPMPIGDH